MKKQCKNCAKSICIKTAGGARLYLCKKDPIPAEEQKPFGTKFKKVKPNDCCECHTPR